MNQVAILIDGGYFIKRLPTLRPAIDMRDPTAVCTSIKRLVASHLERINKIERQPHPRSLLYRSFYYDARPCTDTGHLPVSKKGIDYAKSDVARFQLALHDMLRKTANMAVRFGEVRRDPASLWELKPSVLDVLRKGRREFADLSDEDFRPTFRQKAVDMRIGLDIASLTLKRQVGTIVLIAGDSDFVPAAKLARREGVKFHLDPLWRSVEPGLFEHIDGLYSGLPRPRKQGEAA
ncbi:MAG: NYN domain-containing protein [Amaricoccus sp.]|uniref:NYN domain-containing protein n=1 Tax=Amaricoccus sp. TaxID=1872485 RepID=UPI0039E6FCCD